eukprot:comp19196_c0_seq1/m.21918 comp19196_c0_seq1/g.21918  ORF comp19196_c0_seq1/g.21918 comp19196_c0_seq1/m.21918 type:complete len:409 (-) comp19196_c0_seq1:246-1472(-)
MFSTVLPLALALASAVSAATPAFPPSSELVFDSYYMILPKATYAESGLYEEGIYTDVNVTNVSAELCSGLCTTNTNCLAFWVLATKKNETATSCRMFTKLDGVELADNVEGSKRPNGQDFYIHVQRSVDSCTGPGTYFGARVTRDPDTSIDLWCSTYITDGKRCYYESDASPGGKNSDIDFTNNNSGCDPSLACSSEDNTCRDPLITGFKRAAQARKPKGGVFTTITLTQNITDGACSQECRADEQCIVFIRRSSTCTLYTSLQNFTMATAKTFDATGAAGLFVDPTRANSSCADNEFFGVVGDKFYHDQSDDWSNYSILANVSWAGCGARQTTEGGLCPIQEGSYSFLRDWSFTSAGCGAGLVCNSNTSFTSCAGQCVQPDSKLNQGWPKPCLDKNGKVIEHAYDDE